MTRKELRRIVTQHGRTHQYAAKLKISQRIVRFWLKDERRIWPVIEDPIRSLKPPRKKGTPLT